MAMVSSSDFLRAPERTTAIATLNRQRHLTPSCGGLTPTAERTVGSARISLESLTPRPGIREQNRHFSELLRCFNQVRCALHSGHARYQRASISPSAPHIIRMTKWQPQKREPAKTKDQL